MYVVKKEDRKKDRVLGSISSLFTYEYGPTHLLEQMSHGPPNQKAIKCSDIK